MQRLRSALFMDFDNIFGGLLNLDRTAARKLASDPLSFLERLAGHGLADGHRSLLVRRAYLNPAGYVIDQELGNDNDRLYLQKFRPNLTRAGFEVVDCPALTSAHKNAADIRIVIDVLAALDQPTTYDEIIIASSDADFTPLLQRIRAMDRRTTIVTAGQTAPAYKAVADSYLDEETLIDLLAGDDTGAYATGPDAHPTAAPSGATPAERAAHAPPDSEAGRDRATALLLDQVEAADAPVHLADIGNLIHHELGSDLIRTTRWFGHDTLSSLAAAATNGQVRVQDHWVWDPDRHEPPPGAVELPATVDQVCAITDLPRLPPDRWHALFGTLSHYAATHTFNLTDATAWTRDQLTEAGTPVSRQVIGFVVRGAMYGGIRLDRDPPPSPAEIRQGLLQTTIERAGSAGLDLDDSARDELARWLAGVT